MEARSALSYRGFFGRKHRRSRDFPATAAVSTPVPCLYPMPNEHHPKRICVYCGSGPGTDPAFVQAARTLGAHPGRERHRPGLWRRLGRADGRARQRRARPRRRGDRRHPDIPGQPRARATAAATIIVTRDMHERKQRMFDEADAFVALPGGIGTLEEVVEQMTWAQLGRTRSRSCSPTSRTSGTRCARCSITWRSCSSSAPGLT